MTDSRQQVIRDEAAAQARSDAADAAKKEPEVAPPHAPLRVRDFGEHKNEVVVGDPRWTYKLRNLGWYGAQETKAEVAYFLTKEDAEAAAKEATKKYPNAGVFVIAPR